MFKYQQIISETLRRRFDLSLVESEINQALAACDDTYNVETTIVNVDDIASHWHKTIYAVWVETGTAWLSGPYIVNESNEQDAMDAVVDYLELHSPGLVNTYESLREYGLTDEEIDDMYSCFGNASLYIMDTGSTRIEPIITSW